MFEKGEHLAEFFVRKLLRSSSRTGNELIIPSTKSDTGLYSFKFQGAKLWNSIPREIKHLLSLCKFKRAWRTHLQNLNVNDDKITLNADCRL